MPDADSYESYHATYCESCGRYESASPTIENITEEPVHRFDILEALGGIENVHSTVATEEGECGRCGGQLVKRYYAVGDVPECEYDVDEDQYQGRDPQEDAIVNFGGGWQEAREVPWLEEGGTPRDTDG